MDKQFVEGFIFGLDVVADFFLIVAIVVLLSL